MGRITNILQLARTKAVYRRAQVYCHRDVCDIVTRLTIRNVECLYSINGTWRMKVILYCYDIGRGRGWSTKNALLSKSILKHVGNPECFWLVI